MASIFIRKNSWWIKFRDPRTGVLMRESLQTGDPARAEILRQRIELHVSLLEPRFQAVEIPDKILEDLSICPNASRLVLPATVQNPAVHPSPEIVQPGKRTEVDQAVAAYLKYIQEENAAHHAANKLSMLRRLLGGGRVEKILFKMNPAREASAKACLKVPGFFRGTHLDEFTASIAQQFIDTLPVVKKTKRHYREFLHHFFEICLKFDLYEPSNWHRPNPISALPGYHTKNHRIVFLSQEQIKAQLDALGGHPELQIAVAIMIYAGPRRAEALWLKREAISPNLRYFSVINNTDADKDIESSLKTGERTVTIIEPLRVLLEKYLPTVTSQWLIPNPSGGGRWSGDGFSSKLRTINQACGLKWTCLHFRHTYATQRAAEGWTLFRISREMGNSTQVVEDYYAGYIHPHESRAAA